MRKPESPDLSSESRGESAHENRDEATRKEINKKLIYLSATFSHYGMRERLKMIQEKDIGAVRNFLAQLEATALPEEVKQQMTHLESRLAKAEAATRELHDLTEFFDQAYISLENIERATEELDRAGAGGPGVLDWKNMTRRIAGEE